MASLVFITQAKLQNSSGGETLFFVKFRGSSRWNIKILRQKDPWNVTGKLPSRNLLILARFLWISPPNQLAACLSRHCAPRSSAVLENHPFVVSHNCQILCNAFNIGNHPHPSVGTTLWQWWRWFRGQPAFQIGFFVYKQKQLLS